MDDRFWCKVCGDFMFNPEDHRCPPVFDVRRVDYGEDWYPIRASDSEEAAEKWAETDDYCSADYKIVGGEDAIVEVRTPGDENKIERFTVAGESVAMYYASKKD